VSVQSWLTLLSLDKKVDLVAIDKQSELILKHLIVNGAL
jgi:hypothetical protein